MTEKNKRHKSQKKKAYTKPELKKHSKIGSRPVEIFASLCCAGPEVV